MNVPKAVWLCLLALVSLQSFAEATVIQVTRQNGSVDLALGELNVTVTPRQVGPIQFAGRRLAETLYLSMPSGKWESLGSEEQATSLASPQATALEDRVEVVSEATIGEGPRGKWKLRRTVTLADQGRLTIHYEKDLLQSSPEAGYTYVTLGLSPAKYKLETVEVEASEKVIWDKEGKAHRESAEGGTFTGPFGGVFNGVFSVAFPASNWAAFPETGFYGAGLQAYDYQYQLQCVGYPGTRELTLALDFSNLLSPDGAPLTPRVSGIAPPSRSPVTSQRDRICLNGEWDFRPGGDRSNAPTFGWMTMRVPGSWGHNFGFELDVPEGTTKVRHAWYRLRFAVPSNWNDGRKVLLSFDGVNYKCSGHVNGQAVGDHVGGYAPFDLDITRAVRFDGLNELTLHVDDETPQSLHSGIWRNVYLRSVPAVHLDNVFVMPSVRKKSLSVRVWIRNDTPQAQTGSLRNTVWLGNRKALALPTIEYSVAAGETRMFEVTKPWRNARLWGFGEYGSPVLYHLKSQISDLKPVKDTDSGNRKSQIKNLKSSDEVLTRFGFREFWCDGTRFMFNGKPFVIKGDLVSTAYLIEDNREWITHYFQAERGANINFIRLHSYHDLHPSEWYEVADELGMLIETQQYYRPSSPERYEVLKSDWEGFIRRNWNHPSIAMWSADNEACSQGDYGQPQVVELPDIWKKQNEIHNLINRLDPTRPVEEQGDVRLGTAAAKGLFDNLQVFNAHPYGDPLGKDLEYMKKRYSYNGKIPIHVGEIYYGEQDPFNWWTRPAEMLRKRKSMYLSWRNCGKYYYRSILSVRDHGAAGASLCAGIGTMYFGSKSEDDLRLGPWDCRQTDETFDTNDESDRGRSVNVVYVKTKWPSLSGEGMKAKWIMPPAVGYGAEFNWFDPTRPVFETNVVYDFVRKAFHDWDGEDVGPLAKMRVPEVVVCVTRNGTPVRNAYVWLLPAEGQATEPRGVMADVNGTAGFILERPGRYIVACPSVGERKIIKVTDPPLVAKGGYDHITWVDLGGKRSQSIRTELEKPAEIEIRDRMDHPNNRATTATAKPFQPGPFKPDEQGFIRDWLTCGPFPNVGDREKGFEGYRTDFLKEAGGEAAIQPKFGQTHPVQFPEFDYWLAKSTTTTWHDLHSASAFVDLRNLLNPEVGIELAPPQFVVGYACCYVYSESERDVELAIGSDDGNKVWLNHQLIGEYPTHGAAVVDRSKYKARLKLGRNVLMVKVDQSFGGYGFYLRLLKDSHVIADVQVRLDQ